MILNYYYDFYFSYLLKVVINKYNYNTICMNQGHIYCCFIYIYFYFENSYISIIYIINKNINQ